MDIFLNFFSHFLLPSIFFDISRSMLRSGRSFWSILGSAWFVFGRFVTIFVGHFSPARRAFLRVFHHMPQISRQISSCMHVLICRNIHRTFCKKIPNPQPCLRRSRGALCTHTGFCIFCCGDFCGYMKIYDICLRICIGKNLAYFFPRQRDLF